MDTKRWKVMLAADDYGSFTRVGEELGYTQSGITQMMKALEKEVGFSLFMEDNHGVTLTKEAKALIPAIRNLLNADEEINQEIASLKGAQVGTIRIGTYLSCSIRLDSERLSANFKKVIPISVSKSSKEPRAIWQSGLKIDGSTLDSSVTRRISVISSCRSWMTNFTL